MQWDWVHANVNGDHGLAPRVGYANIDHERIRKLSKAKFRAMYITWRRSRRSASLLYVQVVPVAIAITFVNKKISFLSLTLNCMHNNHIRSPISLFALDRSLAYNSSLFWLQVIAFYTVLNSASVHTHEDARKKFEARNRVRATWWADGCVAKREARIL